MNCSKFFVSFSLILSTTFCGCVLAANSPPNPSISHLGIWLAASDEQSSRNIHNFDFVTLFNDKEAFVVPFKIQNSGLTHLNLANACELAWNRSGVAQFRSVRFETRAGTSQTDSMNTIILPFKIANLSMSGRESTSVLFVPDGTVSILIPDDSIEMVLIDGSRSSKALTVEQKNGGNRWQVQHSFLGERKLKGTSHQSDAYRRNTTHITQTRDLVVSILNANIFYCLNYIYKTKYLKGC